MGWLIANSTEVSHDLYKEKQMRKEIVRLRSRAAEELTDEINEHRTKKAVIETTDQRALRDLKKNHGKEEPKARNEIKDYDFAEKIFILEDRKKGIERETGNLEAQLKRISENRTALVEYDDFPVVSEVELEVDYEDLDRFREEMLRDYRKSQYRGKR